ncbi:inactive hydroxysteroid dehydrogenase-like protein 1 isoform X3 [Malaclemys terrapin pileata]|uniref:inactive hydroxysteroid dehydrogenase-like protein 1 isoform X3 n=1 Tax=Malaclemys terrapin pileata TaxID=2991368 RepID=UPI0023A8D95B|nr:inactive hydroxysteroid dehydrogenase-like protein 1 isoform X3 [Malaclemys terrapin pileata]
MDVFLIAMAAVDSFYLLYREIGRSCSCYMEALALVGAWYVARKCFTLVCDSYSLIRLHFIPKLVSRADFVKQYGRWAVVTGSTAGIGKAYAEELASRGINIILISRSKEKLEAVAKDITETYKVETAVIVADFSKGREIYSSIKEALRDKDIGILVNNVGVFYTYPEYFTRLSEDKLWEIVNVNIAAANMMVHIVLPGMVQRKRGAIVNVSSGSCCKPTPQMAAYSASKLKYMHIMLFPPLGYPEGLQDTGSILFSFCLYSTCQNGSGFGECRFSTELYVRTPYPTEYIRNIL